jgi:hypothetical protein
MKRLLLAVLALSTLLVGTLRAHDHDEFRGPPRDHDRIGRISGVVRDCDQRATDFRHALDHALDHSRLNGSRMEDRLNAEARELDHAISRLRESWNREHDVGRSRMHVAQAIEAGRHINRALEHHALRGRIQREWDDLRSELNLLAEVFGEPQIMWDR